MRIIDLLSQNAVCLGASASGREEALDRLIALQGKAGNLSDAARYRAIFSRVRNSALPRSETGSRCPTPKAALCCAPAWRL